MCISKVWALVIIAALLVLYTLLWACSCLRRCGGAGGVGVGGVAIGIVGTNPVVIGCRSRTAGVGIGGHIGRHGGDLGKADPIGGAFNLEAVFIGRVICPGQIDLSAGNRRRRQIAGGVGYRGRRGAGGVGVRGGVIDIVDEVIVVVIGSRRADSCGGICDDMPADCDNLARGAVIR